MNQTGHKTYQAPEILRVFLTVQTPCAASATGESFDFSTPYSDGWAEE